jgi:hypothetical protein
MTQRPQDIDGAVPKIRNGTFHFPSGRRTNPLTPDYPPLEKPLVRCRFMLPPSQTL